MRKLRGFLSHTILNLEQQKILYLSVANSPTQPLAFLYLKTPKGVQYMFSAQCAAKSEKSTIFFTNIWSLPCQHLPSIFHIFLPLNEKLQSTGIILPNSFFLALASYHGYFWVPFKILICTKGVAIIQHAKKWKRGSTQ